MNPICKVPEHPTYEYDTSKDYAFTVKELLYEAGHFCGEMRIGPRCVRITVFTEEAKAFMNGLMQEYASVSIKAA